MLDILVRNGEVIDGSGAQRRRADLAVQGGRIVAVDLLPGAGAATVIDAAGKIVAPGFIDMHSHEDFLLPIAPAQESFIRQGITTTVMGQCGASAAPRLADPRRQTIVLVNPTDYPLPWLWTGFASYLEFIERQGTAANVIALAGLGTLRASVMGYEAAPPSPDQVRAMQRAVEEALDGGAYGVSSGLIYPPGMYASTDELVEVTGPVGTRGGLYFSHLRGEGETLLAAIAEAIEIGKRSGASVQISHLKANGQENWWMAGPTLELIDQARAEGLDVSADVYPYTAGATGLNALLPDWAAVGEWEQVAERLADPDARRQMAEDMRERALIRVRDWSQIMISSSPRAPEYSGRTVAELADAAGLDPYTWVFDALLESRGETGMILFMMSEENMRATLAHPAVMVGTDGVALPERGPLALGLPHPRFFGTFPRVLGRYTREENLLSLESAVRKMTGQAAEKLGLRERGLLRPGYHADIVVFDPQTVADRATFTGPFHYPAGIEQVIVNGRLVLHDGAPTGALPGRALTR